MPDVTREEFEQLRESHTQTRERVAASEAVQDQHEGAIQHLSNQIASLAQEQRKGIAALSQQISDSDATRGRLVSAAITGGSALGGGTAVGLYQLIHALYPHFFGG